MSGDGSASLRDALGSFISGITVITCRDENGSPIGITVSSFCSLSLDPPMVLWCLGKQALSAAAFLNAPGFAVHVLASDQWPVAERFASRGSDKFGADDWSWSGRQLPELNHFASRFECRRDAVHEGGDHFIVTGEISGFDVRPVEPLAYHRGRYALAHRDEETAQLMDWQGW